MIRMIDLTLLKELVEVAEAAGREILEVYATTGSTVSQKSDGSPLTEADVRAHARIMGSLGLIDPGRPVLSEESASIPWSVRRTWESYWLVDPLDGTREFLARNGEFTVNIALVDNGYPILGVVHAPVLGLTYFGLFGQGAWVKNRDGEDAPIKVEKRTPRVLRVVGSRSHRGASLDGLLNAIGDHELFEVGSSLKLCMVAEGRADFYPRLGPTCEWDTAAAQAVVEAAGGEVTDLHGVRLACNRGETLLNPHFLVFGARTRDWVELCAG